MLTLSLRRTQAELHLHRQWLRTFTTSINTTKRIQPCISVRVACPTWHSRGLAANPAGRKFKIRRFTPRNEQQGDDEIKSIDRLHEAFQARDIEYVIKHYNGLNNKQKNALPPSAIAQIVKTLFSALLRERRQARDTKREENLETLVTFAQRLVSDWRAENIEPAPASIGRVLEFFTETGERDAGTNFWEWIREQDVEKGFADANVYGAAIDLLAVHGTPLVELEALYSEALERYPGDYLAYHLSPTAIVPDRDQEFLGSSAPYQLMKGISRARLLSGASGDAYLAFDSLLRLWPDTNHHRNHLMLTIYQVFMDERPSPEAFTVFAMACRAGTLIPYEATRRFMSRIRMTSDLSHPVSHIHALRQMLSILYLSTGAGSVVTPNMINELLIVMSQTLRIDGIEAVEVSVKQQIVAEVLEIIRKSLETFSRYGAMPGIAAFNSIITNIAGWGEDKTVIDIALQDAKSLGLEPNHVTRRSILTAAGIVKDAGLVRDSWALLLEDKVRLGEWPGTTDVHILIKAATRSNCVDFARKMFEELKDVIPARDHPGIVAHLNAPEPDVFEEGQARAELDVSVLFTELSKLRADIEAIERLTETRPKVQNFNQQALPMTLYVPEELMPENELRQLYDELTTEQRMINPANPEENDTSPEPDAVVADVSPENEPKEPAHSATGLPFGTLRYENWKSVTHLLALANNHDNAFDQAVDEAIATGVAPPERKADIRTSANEASVSYGISDAIAAQQNPPSQEMSPEEVQMARNKILTLRGIAPES